MYFLTYDGSATKVEVTSPAVPKMLDGRAIPNQFIRPAVTKRSALESRSFGGYKFPAGVRVEVKEPFVVRKAVCLKGFTYEGPLEVFDLPAKRRINSDQTLGIRLAEIKARIKQDREEKPKPKADKKPSAKPQRVKPGLPGLK